MAVHSIAVKLASVAESILEEVQRTGVERVTFTADVIGGVPYWDVTVREPDGWVTSVHGFRGDDEDA